MHAQIFIAVLAFCPVPAVACSDLFALATIRNAKVAQFKREASVLDYLWINREGDLRQPAQRFEFARGTGLESLQTFGSPYHSKGKVYVDYVWDRASKTPEELKQHEDRVLDRMTLNRFKSLTKANFRRRLLSSIGELHLIPSRRERQKGRYELATLTGVVGPIVVVKTLDGQLIRMPFDKFQLDNTFICYDDIHFYRQLTELGVRGEIVHVKGDSADYDGYYLLPSYLPKVLPVGVETARLFETASWLYLWETFNLGIPIAFRDAVPVDGALLGVDRHFGKHFASRYVRNSKYPLLLLTPASGLEVLTHELVHFDDRMGNLPWDLRTRYASISHDFHLVGSSVSNVSSFLTEQRAYSVAAPFADNATLYRKDVIAIFARRYSPPVNKLLNDAQGTKDYQDLKDYLRAHAFRAPWAFSLEELLPVHFSN